MVIGSMTAGAAPANGAEAFEFHHADVLGTSLDLTVVASSKADSDAAEKLVLDEVERLRKILSSYDAEAELSKVNQSPVGGPGVKVSSELIEVLKLYEKWGKATGGAYSGHIGTLIAAWKQAQADNKLPSNPDLQKLADACRKPAWQIDEKNSTVRRIADQKINVDSLGKGYIVGKAVAAATKDNKNITGLLLNIGGDIRVWGTPAGKPANSPWAIGIQDPAHPELNAKPLTTVYAFSGQSVASSGAYQRFYTIDGKKYSHIIDARTGRSGKNSAATVVASDAATANALATICCIMKFGEGFEQVRAVPNAEAMIIMATGEDLRTDGFKDLENASAVASAGPKVSSQFPEGFKVSVDLETTATQRKPYVYVWVTDMNGKLVKVLGAYGNEERWMRDMREWWKIAGGNRKVQAMSRATKSAGKYPVSWDGTNLQGSGVPLGQYKVWVEVGSEHGPYAAKSGTITLSKDAATATIAESSAFKKVAITFGPQSK